MADMSDWFIMKDPVEHRQKALKWRRCKSNAERERFVKIDEDVLTEKALQSIQKKMSEFKLPSDLGRIPGKSIAVKVFLTLPLTNSATFS
ncbi:hypothetical protein RclHR1_14210005 [Rhizophagus clarus]|uniref:Uncharacterized protein n=1 Tax=Rhizophagus clarus TaxID=94130 RepID=A0A2Z6R4S3_9GLOM|nr:hypothetical protein RclHR1_14210005 [Rhizophagus clarus]